MTRWDPGAQERLTKAALDLYPERGYDDVTVTDIAERAGLTRRSYFRFFPDMREVLSAGSERLPVAVRETVLSANPAASPLAAVLDAIDEALRERGTEPGTATLVAQVWSVAFGLAFHRRSEADGASFTDDLHAVFDTLRTSHCGRRWRTQPGAEDPVRPRRAWRGSAWFVDLRGTVEDRHGQHTESISPRPRCGPALTGGTSGTDPEAPALCCEELSTDFR